MGSSDSALRELAGDSSSRKRFLTALGGAGAVGAASVLLAACGRDTPEGPVTAGSTVDHTASDLKIVNYALMLEYVAAGFYQAVVDGEVMKDTKTGDVVKRLQAAEEEHVDALVATARSLGGTPASEPKTRFQDMIARGPKAVLETAATIENVGAAAYLGQAGHIASKEILATALSIHSVEARHAAALNELAGRGYGEGVRPLDGSLPDGPFGKPMGMAAVLEALRPYIAA
jgi:rubrerythrin